MKKQSSVITVIFCVFIGIFALLTAVMPKQDISVNEKRVLSSFPSFSVEKLLNGSFESGLESYISDHFFARDFFAGTDAYFKLLTGRNGADGIYKGREGYLINTPVKCDYDKLRANIDAVNKFAAVSGLETKMIVVSSAGAVENSKLPKNHLTYRDDEIIYNIKENSESIEIIDPANEFIKYGNMGDYYYKTDHHWTSEGAYLAYCMWCESEGITPRAAEDYTKEKTDGFYGTSYSKSALWLTKPDTIETWEYPIDVTVTIDNSEEYDSMFFKEHLTELDKYPVFLDGNHAFVRIENHSKPDGKRVLLIKDSYAHCFAPFMAENCSEIDMIDLRYYFDSVSELAEANGYDEVLVLYGISNLCEENDLSILR